MTIIAAGAIVYRPGRGFLLLRNRDYWEFPKGRADEKDESILATALREVGEETAGDLARRATPVREEQGNRGPARRRFRSVLYQTQDGRMARVHRASERVGKKKYFGLLIFPCRCEFIRTLKSGLHDMRFGTNVRINSDLQGIAS